MNTLTQTIALTCFAMLPLTTQADKLTVLVNGVTQATGSVRIAVLASDAAYEDKEPPASASVVAAAIPSVSYQAELPAGNYAVKVMHDVNSNDKMDTNLIGMPKEPFGFSNNAKANFGPPKWKAVVFELNGDKTITIDLVD